jgi:hypothetical protein
MTNYNELAMKVEFFREAMEDRYKRLWETEDKINDLRNNNKRVPKELTTEESRIRLGMSSWNNVIEDADLWDAVYKEDNWWNNLNNQYGGNRS